MSLDSILQVFKQQGLLLTGPDQGLAPGLVAHVSRMVRQAVLFKEVFIISVIGCPVFGWLLNKLLADHRFGIFWKFSHPVDIVAASVEANHLISQREAEPVGVVTLVRNDDHLRERGLVDDLDKTAFGVTMN